MMKNVSDPDHPDPASAASGSGCERRDRAPRAGWILLGAGAAVAAVAVVCNRSDAASAARQVWSPFVLVTGLLLVGLVADEDGLFTAAGHALAHLARRGIVLFCGAAALIVLVTAFLNLDTSVAFLTPVLVYAARRRGEGEAPLLYGCLLLSNAGSLLLPGSNLTNLIVLGHLRLSGAQFLAHTAPAWACAVVITAAVVGIAHRRALRVTVARVGRPDRPAFGFGLAGVAAVVVLVLVLRSPAVPVVVAGVFLAGIRMATRRLRRDWVLAVLGLPVLVGLFGVAVGLGTLGRAWAGPATVLTHVDAGGTAAVAAIASVLVNNLPAAALLAARTPRHPFALLVGLDLGPNLLVTGSLAWILWWRAARSAGARPSLAKASALGALTVPLSMAAALGTLALLGTR